MEAKNVKPVEVIVYVRGGIWQRVKTNLPDDSWEYSVVDYDREPGLSEGSAPDRSAERKSLPSVLHLLELMEAAQRVVDHWASGDLAAAVRALAQILAQLESQPKESHGP